LKNTGAHGWSPSVWDNIMDLRVRGKAGVILGLNRPMNYTNETKMRLSQMLPFVALGLKLRQIAPSYGTQRRLF
jgi:hypothetical protein